MTTRESCVFVVDDDEAMRKSLVRLMEEVGLAVRTFANAESFLTVFDPDQPGCLLLDVRMPGMGGVELQRRLVEEGVELPVIILTGHADVSLATECLLRGAVDFVEKPFRPQPLVERIRASLALDLEQRERRAEHDGLAARFARLTAREWEVVDLVMMGLTNKAIASRLGVSPQAIDARRARAMSKLEVTNVPELVKATLRYRERAR